MRLYQYGSVTGTAASDVDQACLEVTQEDPLGAYAVDYIKYDVKQTPSYYQVEVKLAYAVDPEELSQVISVTGSTAVEQELRALLPDQPEKVVFRISYFTQEDSAETLRQAVQEAYQAQTPPCPPLLGVEVKLYPDSGQQRVAEILLTWQAREHQTVEDFFGKFEKLRLTEQPGYDIIIPADASVAHLVERHLAKVEVASSSLVTRSTVSPFWAHRFF